MLPAVETDEAWDVKAEEPIAAAKCGYTSARVLVGPGKGRERRAVKRESEPRGIALELRTQSRKVTETTS